MKTERKQTLTPLKGTMPVAIPVKARNLGESDDTYMEPLWVRIEGQWLRVAEVQDRFRIDEGWWRESVIRMYFDLLLSDGQKLTVFNDLGTSRWFKQRYTDPVTVGG